MAHLSELEPFAREEYGGFPYLTLQGGIELHGLFADWCRRMEDRVARRRPSSRAGRRGRSG